MKDLVKVSSSEAAVFEADAHEHGLQLAAFGVRQRHQGGRNAQFEIVPVLRVPQAVHGRRRHGNGLDLQQVRNCNNLALNLPGRATKRALCSCYMFTLWEL